MKLDDEIKVSLERKESKQDIMLKRSTASGKGYSIQYEGREVGQLAMKQKDTEITISTLHLLPEYQGRGIGSAVIKHIISEARSHRFSVGLEVLKSSPARHLYERLGFRIINETEICYLMRLANTHYPPQSS